MAERRIGLIPNCMTIIRSGDGENCAVLVTDRRTIIAFEEPQAKGLRAMMKKSFEDPEKALARAAVQTDLLTVDIDKLASINDNLSVPHASIERLQFKKGIAGFSFTIDFRTEDGKKASVFANLAPAKELINLRRKEGISRQEAKRQYAEKAQDVFKRALPPVAAGKAEWMS